MTFNIPPVYNVSMYFKIFPLLNLWQLVFLLSELLRYRGTHLSATLEEKQKNHLSCIYSHQFGYFPFLEGKIELSEIFLFVKLLKQGQAFQYGSKKLINRDHCPTLENLYTILIWDHSLLGWVQLAISEYIHCLVIYFFTVKYH